MSEALLGTKGKGSSYLSDAQATPFLLPQQLQCAFRAIKVIRRDLLEHILG